MRHVFMWHSMVGAGVLVLACGAVLGQAVNGKAEFEVASVKPADPVSAENRSTLGTRGGPGTADPGQITFRYATMRSLLMRAYDVIALQISGPSWLDDINSDKYDIVAKVPTGTTPEQANVMLQNLLVERFGLAVHHESREMQIYSLVAGKGGSKLKESVEDPNVAPPKPGSPPPGPSLKTARGAGGELVLTATQEPLSALIPTLASDVRGLVVDKTGLTGKYDFTMEFVPGSLAAIIQRDLGLKLEGGKAPVDVLVIDHLEKVPSAN